MKYILTRCYVTPVNYHNYPLKRRPTAQSRSHLVLHPRHPTPIEALYVDNFLVAGSSPDIIDEVETYLKT